MHKLSKPGSQKMSRIHFTVPGLPPKKHGEQSMWGLEIEARRLEALRRAAHQAMAGDSPMRANICLSLTAHVGPVNDRQTGDLDSFIAGVCDGLMAAAPGAKLDDLWADASPRAIHPDNPIAILDDSEVISIEARKIVGDSDEPWYEIMLEGSS